jgi:hypothetical protein
MLSFVKEGISKKSAAVMPRVLYAPLAIFLISFMLFSGKAHVRL